MRNNQDSENNKAFYYYTKDNTFYLFKGNFEGYYNAVKNAVSNGLGGSEVKKQSNGLLNLSAYQQALRHGNIDSSNW